MDSSCHPIEPAGPRLTVERLRCQINLPSGIDQPFAAQDIITRIARRDLAGMCGEALAQLSEDGDAIYRIRHLHLELWVDLQGMSEANVARRWGRLLAGSAVRAMAHGSPGQVMRFESAQHFVSAFLRDLIDGRAWHCWYYDEFKLLDRLPWPRLAVQLLVTRPHWIAPTLLELATTGHGHRLIEAWDQVDIDALWQALGFPATPVLAPALPRPCRATWQRPGAPPRFPAAWTAMPGRAIDSASGWAWRARIACGPRTHRWPGSSMSW